MKLQRFFLLLSLFFIHLTQCIEDSYVYTAGRDYGEYSPKLTAQPQLQNILTDFYVCGIDLLQSSWAVTLWNCNCGKRWYRWRRRWRCNYCPNWFWTQVSSARVKYCHKDNWDNQRTQIFSSGKTSTRNWRSITCPNSQFATGIAVALGSQHNVDTGMVGVQLKCQNKQFTQKSILQDTYGHYLTQMSTNPANTFLSGLQFRHLKNDKFTGIKAYFSQNLKPETVIIEYGEVELQKEKNLITIDSFQQENRDIQTIPYTIKFSKSYTVSGSWTNDIEALNNIQFSEETFINPPVLEGAKVLENAYYKPTRSPFYFKACHSTTYDPVNTVETSIPYCHALKGIAVVEEQKARAAYTMRLKYVVPTTNEKIEREIRGVWMGLVYNSIHTNTENFLIPGCLDE